MNIEQLINVIRLALDECGIDAKNDEILPNIDSLSLTQLVIELEDRLTLKSSIVSDVMFSKTKSPFTDIKSLAEYLSGIQS